MSAVAHRVVIVRNNPERVKVVFSVQMENGGGIIGWSIIKLCIILRQFLMSKVNFEHKMVLWHCWIVVFNIFETIFEHFKLVKKPLKGDKQLPDCAVTTMFAASLKQLCCLGKMRKELHILVGFRPIAGVEADLMQK
jgi:hypothetical protein